MRQLICCDIPSNTSLSTTTGWGLVRAANLSERLKALGFGILMKVLIPQVVTNQLYPTQARLARRPGASMPGVVQEFCSGFGLDRRSVSTQMLRLKMGPRFTIGLCEVKSKPLCKTFESVIYHFYRFINQTTIS